MTTPTKALTLSEYMRQPDQLARFTDILGNAANSYVQSVLIVVASDDKLRDCTVQSVYKSALRAASLGLSCDTSLKQAWIVPYNKKVKGKNGNADTWIKEAQFQPHYKGLHTLAMRTGKYWTINVSPVYQGQRVLENPLTGLHSVQEPGGLIGEPRAYNPGLVDVTSRRRRDMIVIGWLAYFKTKKGYEKSVYMSCDEINDHALMYVKDYDKNPNWNDPNKRPTMEMKTVLRQLLSWADLSGEENAKLAEALQADTDPETIDAPAEDIPAEQPKQPDMHPVTLQEARETIGNANGKEKPLGDMTSDELNFVYVNTLISKTQTAAAMVLKEDFRMDPPVIQKTEKIQKELGF